MRSEVYFNTIFNGHFPQGWVKPTDVLISKYNLKIKALQPPAPILSNSFIFSPRRVCQQYLCNLGMCHSPLGLLQPSSHLVTGPQGIFSLDPVISMSEPIHLEIWVIWYPCVSAQLPGIHIPCPLLHKTELHPCTGDVSQSFQSLFISSQPAPASMRIFFSFFFFVILCSSCEICFAPQSL